MKLNGIHEKELFTEDLPFRLIVNQNTNFKYPIHWHSAIELLYVVKNDFTIFINYKEYKLKEKSILFIPSGDIHEFRDEPPTGERIFINFELSKLKAFIPTAQLFSRMTDTRLITDEDGKLYTDILREMRNILDEYHSQSDTSGFFFSARMIDILILLYKSMPIQIKIGDVKNNCKRISGLEEIDMAFKYIESNYGDNIHLKDVACAIGFSEFYFSRIFKEITEKSFHQYLTEYRIKKAEGILSDGNCSISEVAYSVGFNSVATFERTFKKIKGCSPMKFRKLGIGN